METKSIVVCNIQHCLNCGNCIDACKRRHKDVSRHVRERSALLGISLIPNLCRICRDPRCIEACNRNGIQRDEEGHIVVTDNCVGCGLCMRSCPYSAILVFSGQETEVSLMDKLMSLIGLKRPAPIEEKKESTFDTEKVDQVVIKYDRNPSFLIPMLQDVQNVYNYLPREAIECISDRTGIPMNRIYNVVTFYAAFSLVPRGRHTIHVCMGTACHVRGAAKVLGEMERVLGIKAGETTQDMKFTLETVNCLGACALGPVMVIDGEYFGKMTPDKISPILSKFT